MGNHNKRHYADKHQGKIIDDTIADKINLLADNNHLTCAAAHKIAKDLDLLPSEVGVQIDLMEYKIDQCQLGLFGYSPQKKKLNPDIEISKDLIDALNKTKFNGTNTHDQISCTQCWQIANILKIKRLDLGSACEKQGIRIKPCQLGAF
ncbi:MAG: hypothetical protein GY710_23840 [Desulfobacteraceae bacterium]|nr:hypothetical protein [Desulfobacteraceae bacterium]